MEPQVDSSAVDAGSPVESPEERWVDALLRGHAPLPAVLRWLAAADEQADTSQRIRAGEAQRAVRVSPSHPAATGVISRRYSGGHNEMRATPMSAGIVRDSSHVGYDAGLPPRWCEIRNGAGWLVSALCPLRRAYAHCGRPCLEHRAHGSYHA